jgi:hypothetical protein
MLRRARAAVQRLRPRSAYDVMAAIACFGVLAGGTAYAANTVGSADVIDESLLTQDIRNGEVKNSDLANNSVGSGRVIDGSLTGGDIAELTLGKVPDADKLDGLDSVRLKTRGFSSVTPSGYSSSLPWVTERSVTVDVGSTARPVLILGELELWTGSTSACKKTMRLEVDGSYLADTRAAQYVPRAAVSSNNYGRIATSAMPTLSAGSHTIELVAATHTDFSCITMQRRLHAVVLDG